MPLIRVKWLCSIHIGLVRDHRSLTGPIALKLLRSLILMGKTANVRLIEKLLAGAMSDLRCGIIGKNGNLRRTPSYPMRSFPQSRDLHFASE